MLNNKLSQIKVKPLNKWWNVLKMLQLINIRAKRKFRSINHLLDKLWKQNMATELLSHSMQFLEPKKWYIWETSIKVFLQKMITVPLPRNGLFWGFRYPNIVPLLKGDNLITNATSIWKSSLRIKFIRLRITLINLKVQLLTIGLIFFGRIKSREFML